VTLSIGSTLCLATVPFAVGNSLYHLTARYPHPERVRTHAFNAATAIAFTALAFVGSGTTWGDSHWLTMLRLILPIIYYWYAYAHTGTTLHVYYPASFSYDAPLIRWEQKFFGNPSLWMARGRSPWLTEFLQFFYWSYFLFIPVLGIGLYIQDDLPRFEAMALSMAFGYAMSYLMYPWTPLWGPRWALVEAGLLPDEEKVLPGYFFANFMNRIIWSDTAHKGGAMPSAHSAICVIFMIWCVRVWGPAGAVFGGVVGTFMFISTVYARYHYVIDVIVGTAIGILAVLLADMILPL
jgi:membrane-associated phospholipid phosphatase